MIAIIDSGSTKSDWVILEDNYKEVERILTIGFNPDFVDSDRLQLELSKHREISLLCNDLKKIHFYGAGCSSPKAKEVIHTGLSHVFPYAEINVEHDLLAAAYSAYNGKPTIICILGTGSNSCFFDGENLRDDTPSLGYILGDEGSGNHLGRELVRGYITNKLPEKLRQNFEKEFKLSVAEIRQKLYKEAFPNRFLANFSRFVYQHKTMPFIQNMVYNCFRSFIDNQVMVYPESLSVELNCIGSVATYYEDILRDVASESRIKVDQIIQKPINNLVDYHRKKEFN